SAIGITYCKSRYVTITAAQYNPSPTASIKSSPSQTGSSSNAQLSPIPLIAMSTSSSTIATAKSISTDPTVLRGSPSRGKYTFDTSCALPTRQALTRVSVELNAFHPRSPAYANTKYGSPSLDSLATRPNTNAKIAAATSGCTITHATPSAV